MTARRPRARLIAAALALLTFAVYAWRISDTPIYLHDAEVLFALHIHAMATTLHDANGRLLPLYIQMPQIGENVWFHPMLVYFSAPFLAVLPLTEWSLRLPTVVVGVVDVVLMFAVARRIFASRGWGVFAAALLLTTPAHFIHSRFAMDYIYPLPFVLGWLWCLLRYDEDGDGKWIALSAFVLGVGFFSYIGAVMLVPLYFLITCAYVLHRQRRVDRTIWFGAAAFVLPLLLLVLWLPAHPDMIQETVSRYGVPGTSRLSAIRQLLTYNQIQEYISRYWQLSSPGYLFLVGSSNWVDSTRHAGVFLFPVAILLVAGLCDFAIEPQPPVKWVVLAGAIVAPIGAVFVGEPWAIQRELELLPFVVLLSTFGARRMLRSTSALARVAVVASAVVCAAQFAYFTHDYFGDYRLNSIGWFGSNLRGTVDEVLRERESDPPEAIYISTTIPYAMENWKLYLAGRHRDDWWPRLRSFDAKSNLTSIPRGSLVIEPAAGGQPLDPAAASPGLVQTAMVVAPEGGTRFMILERR